MKAFLVLMLCLAALMVVVESRNHFLKDVEVRNRTVPDLPAKNRTIPVIPTRNSTQHPMLPTGPLDFGIIQKMKEFWDYMFHSSVKKEQADDENDFGNKTAPV